MVSKHEKGSQEIRGASTGYSGRVWQQTKRLPRDLLGDPSSSSVAIFLDPAYSLTKCVWRIAKSSYRDSANSAPSEIGLPRSFG